MSRSCRAELAAWRPALAQQVGLRAEFLALAEGSAVPWARDTVPAHLTASAVICTAYAAQVLLVLHAKVGRWLQTGGHLEAGDRSLPDAALREAREESGIASPKLLPGILDLHVHPAPCVAEQHLDVRYVAVADRAWTPVRSAESTDIGWFDVARLPDDLEPALVVSIERAVRRLRPAAGVTG